MLEKDEVDVANERPAARILLLKMLSMIVMLKVPPSEAARRMSDTIEAMWCG